MSKTIQICILFFTVIALSGVSHADSWVPYFKTNRGSIFLFSEESVRRKGSILTVWTKLENLANQPGLSHLLYLKEQVEINCSDNTARFIAQYFYRNSYDAGTYNDPHDTFQPTPPEGPMDVLTKGLCRRY